MKRSGNNRNKSNTSNPSADGGGDVLSGGENAENSSSINNNNFNGDVLLKTIASRQSQALLSSTSSSGGNNNNNNNNTPLVTLTIYIPTSSVGAVIGRRGQNIANVQKAASAYASTNHPVRVSIVSQDGNSHNPAEQQQQHSQSVPYTYSELDWSDAAWTPVVIRADPCAALTAAAKLEDIAGKGHVDEVVLDVPLSRTKHAALVGKRGQTLGALSADANVRIMVPAKELRHDIIQLEGQLSNVKQCLANILQIVAKQSAISQAKPDTAQQQPAGSNKASTEKTSAEDVVQQTVPVLPNGAMPSQTKLRTIGRKTDCTIKKKKITASSAASASADSSGGGDVQQQQQQSSQKWHLVVTGSSSEQVQAAVAILQKWNEDNKDGASGAGSGQQQQPSSPNRRGRRRPNTNAKSPKRGGGGKSKQQQQQQQAQSSNAAAAAAAPPTPGGESTA